MSVTYKAGDRSFKASQVLWAKQELVEAIIEQALLGQTEAFIDLTLDCEKPESITRASVNEALRGVKESTGEFLDDMLGDLTREIKRRLEAAQYGAAVTGIKYDLAGDVTDIEVDVSVTFSE